MNHPVFLMDQSEKDYDLVYYCQEAGILKTPPAGLGYPTSMPARILLMPSSSASLPSTNRIGWNNLGKELRVETKDN